MKTLLSFIIVMAAAQDFAAVSNEASFKACEPLLREVKKKFSDAFVVKLKNNQPYQ